MLGDQRGGTLGFPTANLAVPADLLVPAYGIYAGEALGHRAAISIGTNPHYGGGERRVEAFLLDFEGDLYGERLVVALWERLRDEAVFGSEAELVAAISDDVGATRRGTPARSDHASFPRMGHLRSVWRPYSPTRPRWPFSTRSAASNAARSTRSRPPEAPWRRTPAARRAGTSAGFRSASGGAASAAPLRRGSAARPVRPIALTPPK